MPHRSDLHRSRHIAIALAAGAACAVLLVWLAAAAQAPAAVEGQPAPFPWSRASTETEPVASAAAAPPPVQARPAAAPPGGLLSPMGMAAPDAKSRGVFQLDAQGRLVIDQPARLRIEALLALHEGEALAARLEAELAGLPPAAVAHARALVSQFEAYQSAQAAAFPPGQALLVPEEGLAQLNAMQAMRAAHFGAEAARQLFAQDDATARRILELMREDTSTSRSMEEKAMQAQARYAQERGAVPP